MQRLQSRGHYQAVIKGPVVSKTSHFALHQLSGVQAASHADCFGSEGVWLGAMVPKRWAKRAVTRNMIKRQVYCFTSQAELPWAAYLVRLRAEFSRSHFLSATSKLLKVAVKQELNELFNGTIFLRQSDVLGQQLSPGAWQTLQPAQHSSLQARRPVSAKSP